MKPINKLDALTASGLKYILCDIDDTITNGGKLTSAAYSAMWRLHDAGLRVIPVTGRPAGWCDLIVREWPVEAVIGENGAFVFYSEDGIFKTYTYPGLASAGVREKLESIGKACLKQVPGCRAAGDQPYRRYDLAIDFNEDAPHLGLGAAKKIRDIGVAMGAMAKISSIHVNIWFGDYDKLKMAELFLREVLHETEIQSKVLFFGDSPNDEPMFAYFQNSCGVSNLMPFIDLIRHRPAYITEREGGFGFSEGAERVLKLRGPGPAELRRKAGQICI